MPYVVQLTRNGILSTCLIDITSGTVTVTISCMTVVNVAQDRTKHGVHLVFTNIRISCFIVFSL